jgi:hypothetical protein
MMPICDPQSRQACKFGDGCFAALARPALTANADAPANRLAPPRPAMQFRLAYLLIAAFGVILVLTSGWLGSSHNRLAGILVLLISAVAAYMGLRPSRP